MKKYILPMMLALAGCAVPVNPVAERAVATQTSLPPMKVFISKPQRVGPRANADIARDFLDLSFQMESGRELERFTRFEGPIRIATTRGAPASLTRDLDGLIGRLQREAGIDIRRARQGETVNILIETLPRATMQAIVPQAACFVVPRVQNWSEFRRSRRTAKTDWASLEKRERVTIFIPGDVSPQEIRDCLHEETAQALGPLNDLYRLSDSVFNDDNFHTVLTGFDMLVLRAYYDPSLKNGMTRDEVAARLPAILSRLNPGGQNIRASMQTPTPRAWSRAVETALGPKASDELRLKSAKRAVEIANGANWRDGRTAFSLFILGRMSMATDPDLALASYMHAASFYQSMGSETVQAAHVAMQMAAFALSSGNADAVIGIVDANISAARVSENAALLASLMMLKAEALALQGKSDAASALRIDSLGWARYGFGSDRDVRARLAEIAALTPRKGPL